MNKMLIFCTALMISGPAIAQKANVNKLRNKIDYATTPVAPDYSNVKPEDLAEFRTLIEPALTHEESKDNPDLWRYASRMKIHDMNEMLKAYQANGNKLVDAPAFYQNQADIVTYLETYNRLINTPNEKGKIKMKEEERIKERTFWQQHASKARTNLIVAASQNLADHPDKAIAYLDLYYKSASDPLFEGLQPSQLNSMPIEDTYYFYAQALKNSNADAAKIKEYLEKTMESKEYGKYACFELMDMDKKAGNMESWKQRAAIGTERYPEETAFSRMLLQQYINDKDYQKADALADKLIEQSKTSGNVDEYAYYFKAFNLFNQDKFEESYAAFVACEEVKPDFEDAYIGAGMSAWKLAQANSGKPASKEWYAKAISAYEKTRELIPDDPDKWGFALYACYNNSGNTAKAKEFKKYDHAQ